MKAVLVLDIPNDIDISKVKIGGDGNIYYIRDGERASIVGNIKNIKPLPQKLKLRIQREWITDYDRYEIGYNACLDKITGETKWYKTNTRFM